MIRAICLNPVLDRTYHIDGFMAGKKYFGARFDFSAGGKGINVAKVMRQCGENVVLYGFIAGTNGNIIREELEKEGVESFWIMVPGNTREALNIIDHERKLETEIVEEGPEADEASIGILMEQLKRDIQEKDIVICSGMSIAGAPADIYSQINQICKRAGARCFIDSNQVTLQELEAEQYDFYKPNVLEIRELLGKEALSVSAMVNQMQRLLEHSDGHIMISMGGDGAILIGKDFCLKAEIPQIEVVSTIGSGDSTVAGFAIGIKNQWDIRKTFAFSMACGIVNAQYTQVGHVDYRKVREIEQQIRIVEYQQEELAG